MTLLVLNQQTAPGCFVGISEALVEEPLALRFVKVGGYREVAVFVDGSSGSHSSPSVAENDLPGSFGRVSNGHAGCFHRSSQARRDETDREVGDPDGHPAFWRAEVGCSDGDHAGSERGKQRRRRRSRGVGQGDILDCRDLRWVEDCGARAFCQRLLKKEILAKVENAQEHRQKDHDRQSRFDYGLALAALCLSGFSAHG